MGRRKKENKFDDLDDKEFCDQVSNMTTDEIKGVISKVALNQMELMEAKENDQDLQEKKEAYSEAGAIYRDGTKQNRLKQEFCKQVLGDRGVV